jgi:hypothetical protein
MDYSKSLALISIAGFAVQRTLELLDPLFVGVVLVLQKLGNGKLPFNITENAMKTWVMALSAFVVSIPLAMATKTAILGPINPEWAGWDVFITALAISAGSNGVNSVLKFGEFVKDSRKVEVKPLPEVKVNPSTATIKTNATLDILASVAGTDNRAVEWKVLEGNAGGTVTPVANDAATGRYTAPPAAGEYHVAAISKANPSATAFATIKVA